MNNKDYIFEKIIDRSGFFLISHKSFEEFKEKDSRFLQKLKDNGINVSPAFNNHYKLSIN